MSDSYEELKAQKEYYRVELNHVIREYRELKEQYTKTSRLSFTLFAIVITIMIFILSNKC